VHKSNGVVVEKIKNVLKKFKFPIVSTVLVVGLIGLATFGSTWGDRLPAEPENTSVSTSSVPLSEIIGSKDYDSLIVYFDTNGGSYIDPEYVQSGDNVTRPDDPTKDGYGFDGWFSDPGLTQPYDFGDSASLANLRATKSADGVYTMTLFAKWLNRYNVSFNIGAAAYYDETPPATQSVVDGYTATDPGPMPNYYNDFIEEFKFVGWYTDYKYTTPYDFNNTPVTGNTTIYAKWICID
jgi:uncharacterized repeat protein (TIGR02543 family)